MTTAAETEAARPARPVSRSRAFRRTPLGRALVKIPFWILIIAIFVYALFPFYWALRSAFMPANELFTTPIKYWPTDPTLNHFREVLGSSFFRRALLNSTIVAGSVTLLSLAIGSLAAYALGRFRFHGRSFVLYLMLSMTIFPQIAILGALYTMISDFHLYDRLGSLILTYLIFTLPFTVWVLTSFMRALPGDLERHCDRNADALGAVQRAALGLAEVHRDEGDRDEYQPDGKPPGPEGTARAGGGAFRPSDARVQDGKPCCSLPRHGNRPV